MGIADLFRPKHRHSNVRVRTEAVKAMTSDDAELVKVARTDNDIGVRRLAIEKIAEAPVLAEIAAAETERSLRDFAGERAAQLWKSKACGSDEDAASHALSGLLKLGEQRAVVDVAVKAQLPSVRKRAFGELRDPRALAELAKNGDAPEDIRLAAIGRIDDGDVLRAVAIDTTAKQVGLAAVEKIDDADRLENIAQKAKNKAVRQRARKIVTEMSEADKQKRTPVVPDDVKRRRAEKAQLVRELEALSDTFDFDKHSSKVTAAQAEFTSLAAKGADDGDDRFTKAVERFWKRKEIFEQQARSADELRAVEREAQAAKDRAAAERAPEAPKPALPPRSLATKSHADDIVNPAFAAAEEAAAKKAAERAEAAANDPQRAEREAEAKARREERERMKAEGDARRAAEQAEREAKKKEAAERGAAIAQSLTAMIEDMEKLAADGAKDGREIDRLLQQAGRAFEQIGKAAPDQRDALADRYTAVRGKLVVRASEMREAQDWQRFQNVPKAEALIATAKDMAAEEPSPELGNRLRQLQALWKEVGPMPQRRSKELWEQFKKVCDEIYDKVKGFRAVETEKFADVTKAKEALIAEAEALADAEVTPQAANALKALQARWKESGHLPRRQGDDLWKRFRAACDKFFERRKPMLDAELAQQTQNLAQKQALVERALKVAANAPGEGGWGKAIGQIKDLQREWKDIGHVPRRDADAIYKAFRAACDSLFAKRDESRDAEANAHREAIEDVKAEIGDILVGGDDVVGRAIALRAKARELDSRELAQSIEQMTRHVITSHPDAVKGTELDPTALKNRRDKLIAKAEELLPKTAPAVAGDADIASQLKAAMQKNAFGDLRFSGRDPVEVVDELRTQWLEAGPVLDDADRAQATRFEETLTRVLDAAGAAAKAPREERGERPDRGDRRDRRRRRDAEAPAPSGDASPYPQSVHDAITAPASYPVAAAVPQPSHDVATAPAKLPFEPLPAPPVPAAPAPEPARAKASTMVPPMDDLDGGWDMGDDDPTAPSESEQAAAQADADMQRPDPPTPPSASEMAGDGAVAGDGIDEPGWD